MKKDIYDVIVIGGGPSGLMCAGTAGSNVVRVLLLEKNNALGRKIIITGKGRCNVTQAEFDIRTLVSRYRHNSSFLFSSFHNFGPQDIIDFFESRGVALKVEQNGRVFPVSDDARDIVDVMEQYLKENHVEVRYQSSVQTVVKQDEHFIVTTRDGDIYQAKNVVIATGGLSYPGTGSTGDGYQLAQSFGHTIVPTSPALVPLKTTEAWTKAMPGLSLKDVLLTAWQGDKKITERRGDMLFTHMGVSGPIVMDMSQEVLSVKKNADVYLTLNLKPDMSAEELDCALQKIFKEDHNKQYKNVLATMLSTKLLPYIIEQSGIDAHKPVHSITKEERKKIRELLQSLRMTVEGDLGYMLAIVTSGGVNVTEIDPKTMQSKIVEGLYIIGETLDIDGPTGGYNLHVAWSTGYTAGMHIGTL